MGNQYENEGGRKMIDPKIKAIMKKYNMPEHVAHQMAAQLETGYAGDVFFIDEHGNKIPNRSGMMIQDAVKQDREREKKNSR
ncbi:MAG: hypothetical protein DHS20C01_09500 [marine bacterium B5-7]|nr:MAG: hypothetical protein DHS20C01_09500 [marine bacterium B5-7]